MEYLTSKKYSFVSSALDEDTFGVVSFKGFEALSKPYEFDIMLVSDNPSINLFDVLQKQARFTIHREDGENVDYHGILAQFEELQEFKGVVFYRALLVPRLWWLSLTYHNQVILNKKVTDIIRLVLEDTDLEEGGRFFLDFEFKISQDRIDSEYREYDYVCQYNESHLNFVSRWLEREGIYYYFEQTPDGEKVIFTDSKIAHTDLPQEKDLYYSPPSGLDTLHRTETIKSFTCCQRMLPQKVILKEYNYERPSLEISGTWKIDERGRGKAYYYGEHFPTPEEGTRLAKIRAEELLCRKEEFFGKSTVPFMTPGYTFTMRDHFRDSFNQKYLVEEVTHKGSQTGYLVSGLSSELPEREKQVYYQNEFKAIPASVQYRPERKTIKPRISGTLHAKIDAEGTGKYAEIDDQGRYKVRLPFDINDGHLDGKASSFVRMIQPYAGSDHGMHFPLHKGTEVLLTFIDGDPDRPLIAGAVPNPESPSMVSRANQTSAGFKTAGGNQISLQDIEGNQRVIISAGDDESRIICGSGSGSKIISKSDFEMHASNWYTGGGVVASVLSSFSQSLTAGAIVPTMLFKLTSHVADQIYQNDQLGHKIGALDEDESWKGWTTTRQLLLSVPPMVLNLMICNWMTYSMAKYLEKNGVFRLGSGFGSVAKQYKNKWEDLGKWGRTKRFFSSILKYGKTFLIGNTGDYGAMLFCNGTSTMAGLVDPRRGSSLQLSPIAPDVLVASGQGFVDVEGLKGVNLISHDTINIEGAQTSMKGSDTLFLCAGQTSPGVIAIQKSGLGTTLDIEVSDSLITLQKDTIDIKVGKELNVSINKITKQITVQNDKNKITLDAMLGINFEIADDEKISIKMNKFSQGIFIRAPQTARMSGENTYVDANNENIISGKKITVGSVLSTESVNFKTNEFKVNGKKISFG